MKNNPLVSVVTVTYNAEAFLEETIKSVIAQDYPNIEYIIIDGGSTDGTSDIIRKYEKSISYWVSEHDGGIYEAMNKGIDKVTGQWINFMNAGDCFVDGSIISNFLKDCKFDTEIYSGGINFIDGVMSTYRPPNGLDKIWVTVPCWHQGTLIRASVMKMYKYPLDYKIAGDHEFFLRCYKNKHNFQFTDKPIANMLSGGLHEKEALRAKVESLKILFDYCPSVEIVQQSNFFSYIQGVGDGISNLDFSNKFNIFFNIVKKISAQHKKIALYGYGVFGQTISALLGENITVIFDQNTFLYENKDPKIYSPKDIASFEFDILLITVLGREEEIMKNLIENGADPEKIFTFFS